MAVAKIMYSIKCSICGIPFLARRKHAKTCSSRCRFIRHKVHDKAINFASQINYEIFKPTNELLKAKTDFVKKSNMKDLNGNKIELIDGYVDNIGNFKILVFRCNSLRFLNVWNEFENDIIEEFYTF